MGMLQRIGAVAKTTRFPFTGAEEIKDPGKG